MDDFEEKTFVQKKNILDKLFSKKGYKNKPIINSFENQMKNEIINTIDNLNIDDFLHITNQNIPINNLFNVVKNDFNNVLIDVVDISNDVKNDCNLIINNDVIIPIENIITNIENDYNELKDELLIQKNKLLELNKKKKKIANLHLNLR